VLAPAAFVALSLLPAAAAAPVAAQGCDTVVMDLQARLPNGVAIDLCGLHLRNVGEVIEALGRMRCSASCEGLKVYLHREPVDFRLSINGLAVRVGRPRGLDPFASCVYVFSNRRRDRVKILGWERNGFWLLLKRLEKDRFIRPWTEAVSTLTAEQLHWLLEGIDIAVVQHHALLRYSSVA
jgi:transposase